MYVPVLVDAEVLRSWVKTAVLTAYMGGLVMFLVQLLWDGSGDWSNAFYVLFGAVAAGILVICVGSKLLKMPELAWTIGRRA